MIVAAKVVEPALFLLCWCVQLTWAERLAKPGSTHPSFPMDAFAKPTFKLIYDDDNPISNHSALELLKTIDSVSIASNTGIGEYDAGGQDERSKGERNSFYLHRTSPSTLHLCTIPEPRQETGTTLHLNESSLKDHRSQIVQNALRLLSPLKDTCLYRTMDWFTYSLCYGDAIKQFRALPGTTGGLLTPAMDNTQDSYVLGRWNDGIEVTRGIEQAAERNTEERSEQGTELMELVHFSSLEGTDSDRGKLEEKGRFQSQTTIEGKGRYISQFWTDGTRCIINNELRSAEVQFHCSKSPAVDRISLIKEVTTCNYVVVVETPRICGEPALAHVEDEVREVRCRPIVSDEEMERRRQMAKDTVEGGTITSSKSHAEADKENPATADASKIGRDILKASIESIMKRISSAAGEIVPEMEVIVGWDEDNEFIIQPNTEGATIDVEKLLGRAPTPSDDGITDEGKEEIDEKTKDKWDSLMEKLEILESQIAEAHEADQTLADEAVPPQAAAAAGGMNIEGKPGAEAVIEEKGNKKAEKTPTLPRDVNPAEHSPPSRTNQMIRETENFAQRVERFYKAQEAKKQKEQEEQKQKENAQPAVTRNRNEL